MISRLIMSLIYIRNIILTDLMNKI